MGREWMMPCLIGSFCLFLVLFVITGKIKITSNMTKKDHCEIDCKTFFSNGPDWTCVKDCMEVNK